MQENEERKNANRPLETRAITFFYVIYPIRFSGRVNKPSFEGGRGRGRRNEKRELPSKEDLDKELDSYVNAR